MKAYFVSGIGADCRLFKYIQLPAGFEAIYIEWLMPKDNELLQGYAARLAATINTDEPFVLIGLSLGGIMATEMAKLHKPVCTILIASVSVSSQLPPYFKIARNLKLDRLFHPFMFKTIATLKHLFTSETPEEKKLMKQIIRESKPQFIKWAIKAVLNWENECIPPPLLHIHGTHDEVFPFKYIKPTHIIYKGGHTLTICRSAEINSILHEILPQYLQLALIFFP